MFVQRDVDVVGCPRRKDVTVSNGKDGFPNTGVTQGGITKRWTLHTHLTDPSTILRVRLSRPDPVPGF